MMRVSSLCITSWCIADSTHPSPRKKKGVKSQRSGAQRSRKSSERKLLAITKQNTSPQEPAWKVISLDIAASQAEIRESWKFYCQASLTLTCTPKILHWETGSSHLSEGKGEQTGWEPTSSIRLPLPLGGSCCASLALPITHSSRGCWAQLGSVHTAHPAKP